MPFSIRLIAWLHRRMNPADRIKLKYILAMQVLGKGAPQ
jgi:hypothetical protein